jgi:hypothetical protein
VKIPARAPLAKQAHWTRLSPGPQVPLRGLAYEVGALGAQRGRSTASLADARTVDYSYPRDSMQSVDAPSSMSERFVTDGHLSLCGRNDARCTGRYVTRRTRAARCHPACCRRVCRPSAVPVAERLLIVPATRGLRKNLGGPSCPPEGSPGQGRASNGDVARLIFLVLGRSKADSVSPFERALVRRPGMLRRSLRRAGRRSAWRSRTPCIVR